MTWLIILKDSIEIYGQSTKQVETYGFQTLDDYLLIDGDDIIPLDTIESIIPKPE